MAWSGGDWNGDGKKDDKDDELFLISMIALNNAIEEGKRREEDRNKYEDTSSKDRGLLILFSCVIGVICVCMIMSDMVLIAGIIILWWVFCVLRKYWY